MTGFLRASQRLFSQYALLLILVLALGLRLWLWSQPLHQLANDEVEYVTVARDLLAGRGWQFYDHYHWLRAPLYPLFLAGSLWLAGGDLHRAALPNIALSVACVYLGYWLALPLLGDRRVALLAALLAALLLTLATFASLYMCETLFTFLFIAGLLCLVRTHPCPHSDLDDRRPTSDDEATAVIGGQSVAVAWPWLIAAGVLFGLATLTRSITLLFLPVVCVWLLLRSRDNLRSVRSIFNWRSVMCSLLFVLCALLVIAPWTIRNYQAYGRMILVETGLSYNLWAFSEPREDQETIFKVLEEISNPAARSDYATAKGLERLREDPMIMARKLWPAWTYLWRVKPIEDRFLQESYYGDVELPMFASALLFDDALYLLIALAGIAGLVLWRDPTQPSLGAGRLEALRFTLGQPRSLLVLWVLYAIATMLLTHAEGRYRHFLFPVLIPYAAWALRWVRGQGSGVRGPQIGRPGDRETGSARVRGRLRLPTPNSQLLVLIALWLLIGGVALAYYPWEWAGQNLARGWYALAAQRAHAAGDDRAAVQADQRVLAARETPDGWIQLGVHTQALGDTAGAVRAFRDATRMAPPYVAAVARLGNALRASGDSDKARAAFVGDYVDQQRLADWSWRELHPAPRAFVDVGDGLDFGYVGGVYQAEQQQDVSTRWTTGRAWLRLAAPAGRPSGPLRLRLRLAAPHPDPAPTSADVCIAGRCQSLSIGPALRVYLLSFDVPADVPQTIEIRSATFDAPDDRRLGVIIDWAELR